MRSVCFRWVAGFLVALLAAAAVGVYTWVFIVRPCDVGAITEASDFLVIQLKQYDRVYASAATGTRTSITYPVTVMQQILVDTQQVDVPACLGTAKGELLDYMGTAIRALQAYSSSEADQTIRDLVYASNTHFDNFYAELRAVKKCTPYCFW